MTEHKHTDQDHQRPPGPVGLEADRWSLRLGQGPLTADEARLFNQWMAANPKHEQAFQVAQALRHEMPHVKNLGVYREWMRPSLYESLVGRLHLIVQKLTKQPSQPRYRWSALGGLAAVTTVAFALVLLNSNDLDGPTVSFVEIGLPPVETQIAEVKDLTLPDGSIITIGAASSVSVAYTENERRVILKDGEAFFDVKKDKDRPFIVVAQNTLVRVLGTKFNVSLGADVIDVAVSEGRVEVIRPDAGRTQIRESDVKHVLTAGQKVSTPKRGRVEPVQTIKVEDVASWRRGELVWADTQLRDIVADLNRYSEDGIELRARSYADLEFTLAVQADDIPAAVALIAASLNLDVDAQSDGKLVLR